MAIPGGADALLRGVEVSGTVHGLNQVGIAPEVAGDGDRGGDASAGL